MFNPVHELKDLYARQESFARTMENIAAKAEAENRSLTPAETRDFDRLENKVNAVKAQIAKFGTYENFGDGRAPFINTGDGSATRSIAGAPTGRQVFETFGEQLRSVIQAGMPGGQTDSKLYEVRAASGLNETVGSEGGFLVQSDFSYSLLEGGMAAAKFAPRVSAFPVGPNSNGVKLPMVDETSRASGSRFGGITLAWGDEASTITASKPKFRQLELSLNKLTGACYLTDEVVQDAQVLDAFVRRAFSSEFGWVIDNAIMRGTGAGQPLGFLNSGALVTVPKETGQPAKTIVTENIVNMYARQANPEGAVWLANKDTFPQLSTLTIGVGTAGQIVSVLQQGISGSPSGMGILGRPILWMEQCSTLGTVADLCFVDPSRYLLATKGGLQVASSIHVRFLNDESVLRFVYRVSGQPDLNSPITPANSTATESPFVVLAAR